MSRKLYVIDGAKLQCDKGTAIGILKAATQKKAKINGKSKATNKDKMVEPPFFGMCSCTNKACSPALQEWQYTSRKSGTQGKRLLLDTSEIICSTGGKVFVKDPNQHFVGTGKNEPELDKKYARLEGEIIFANGYLSSSLGGALNALLDLNPDEPDPNLQGGWNADENDKTNGQDILLDKQVQEAEAMTDAEKKAEADAKKMEIKFKYPILMVPPMPQLPSIPVTVKVKKPAVLKDVPEMTLQERVDTFYGYWNEIGTYGKGSKTYADHFNAGHNQHFLNGSHGLASNAAHRMDHGIAQGYHWAKYRWQIKTYEEVEEKKEKTPYIKSYSPAYKPVTIVMHSQGNAPGVGFALGLMNYALELGWEQIPLNLIFLGVHQPQNLWEDKYETFVNHKVKHYLADTDFWDTISNFEKAVFLAGNKYIKGGVILKQYLSNKKDRDILKYLNGISELFSPKHHKLRHKRGIYEHLKAITNFGAIKKRSVQFTFANDHADIVVRDGDIPYIDSACNPKRDKTLYSVEFLQKVPADYTTKQGKEVIAMENGGNLVIPPYSAIQRLKAFKDDSKKDGVRIDSDWASYKSIAIDWGNAMSTYRKQKREYHRLVGQKLSFLDLMIPGRFVARKSLTAIKNLQLSYWFRKVIYHYARIQIADLYAHFSPVEFINNKKILKISSDFNDSLGNESIWERIKKTGEGKFYRVEYDKDPEKVEVMTEEAKRKTAEKYVEGAKGKKHLVNTSIADNNYINNVIKAYVHRDKDAEKQLYDEPSNTDVEFAKLQKKLGLTGKEYQEKQKKYQEQLLKEMQVKQDNTKVVTPKKIN